MSSQIDVERVVGLIAQSISLLQMERADDALQCLSQALEIAPDFPVALVKRGAAMRDAALQAALATLDDDLSQTPVQVTVLYERAQLLLRLMRDAAALAAFQQVLECDACHAGALNAMGESVASHFSPAKPRRMGIGSARNDSAIHAFFTSRQTRLSENGDGRDNS